MNDKVVNILGGPPLHRADEDHSDFRPGGAITYAWNVLASYTRTVVLAHLLTTGVRLFQSASSIITLGQHVHALILMNKLFPFMSFGLSHSCHEVFRACLS